jgi:ribosome maturation factor RimP
MKKKQIEQTVKNLVGDIITSLGYELWSIEYYNDGIEWLLEIMIDKPGGISLDDCEKVTRAVNPAIDEADPIENSYSLAVSSPGLNRELKNAGHLNKYINKQVTVKMFAKNEAVITGEKTFHAVLKEFSPENYKFEIAPDNSPVILAKKEIAHIYAYDEIRF